MMSKRGNQTVCVPYGKDLLMQFHKIEGQCFPVDPEKVHNPGEVSGSGLWKVEKC